MKHLKFLKNQLKKDLHTFWIFLNPYTHFTDVFKSIKIIFLILFFPYVIMIWYSIRLYRYFFIYSFLILDIIFFDIISNKMIRKIYKLFYRIIFYIFYYPIFIFLPKCYLWIRHKLSFEFWLMNIIAVLSFITDIVVYFLNLLLRFIIWIDHIDETYNEIRFYWIMRRDLIWGFKYKRRLKRKKKEEIRRKKKEERDAIRDARIIWLKSIRDKWVIKIIDLLLVFYDKIWFVLRWYYFYRIYLTVLYKFKYYYFIVRKKFFINFTFYYWKFYEILRYLGFRYSGWFTYYFLKSFLFVIYYKYLRFCQIFVYGIFSWFWRIYFFIYNTPKLRDVIFCIFFMLILFIIYLYFPAAFWYLRSIKNVFF
jgi:hypothetical protein